MSLSNTSLTLYTYSLKTKDRPPLMPSMKPRISRPVGNVHVRSASSMMSKTLFISTKASTGPAGPFASAVWMKDFPIVSITLPKMPIKNSLPSKGATERQYHVTPISSTTKLAALDVPKEAVRASKLYLGYVMNFAYIARAMKKHGVMKPQRIAIHIGDFGS